MSATPQQPREVVRTRNIQLLYPLASASVLCEKHAGVTLSLVVVRVLSNTGHQHRLTNVTVNTSVLAVDALVVFNH